MARYGTARHGTVRNSSAWHGMAWLSSNVYTRLWLCGIEWFLKSNSVMDLLPVTSRMNFFLGGGGGGGGGATLKMA